MLVQVKLWENVAMHDSASESAAIFRRPGPFCTFAFFQMKIALLFSLILKVSSGSGFTGLDFKLRSNLFLYLNSVAQAKA